LNAQLPNKLIISTDTFFLFEPEIDYDFSLIAAIKIGDELYDELSLSAYLSKTLNLVLKSSMKIRFFFNEDEDVIKRVVYSGMLVRRN
jgi:hypothetical protein